MNIDSFANHVFLKNIKNNYIHLELDGIPNNKTLFFFYLIYFVKG